MSWARFDPEWGENETIDELDDVAFRLHVLALCNLARRLSDGRVTTRAVARLLPGVDIGAAVAQLVDVGLWQRTENGYYVTTWNEHVRSADEEAREREQNRERQERKRRHDRGDHSKCDRCWAKRHGVTNSVSHGDVTALDSTRLDSSRSGSGETSETADRASSAEAPLARPPRASDGSLIMIDEQTLAVLPWDDVPVRCVHRDDGLTWEGHQHFACDDCDRRVRGDLHPDYAISALLRSQTGFVPGVEVWQELLDVDAKTTTFALDVASLIARKAGDVATTPTDVERAAENIYRNLDAYQLADAYAAVQSRQEQNA